MSETERLRAALAACVDAMRRSDPAFCGAQEQSPTTDDEWNAALRAGEDALEAEGAAHADPT